MNNKTFIKDGVTCRKLGGYIFVQVGLVFIAEHRLAVESHIKRELNQEETIHHIDYNKENNSIDNLMLFPNQSEHQKFHLKIRQFGLTHPVLRQIKERWNNLNTQQSQQVVDTFPPSYHNSLGGL